MMKARSLRYPACQHCSVRTLCLSADLGVNDLPRLEGVILCRRRIATHRPLFRQGDAADRLFAIRSGSARTASVSADGAEQILGFHFPGDILGLEGLGEAGHDCTAESLEDSEVCVISLPGIDRLASELPSVRHQLFRLVGRQIQRQQNQLFRLACRSSERRLTSFLVDLIERNVDGNGIMPTSLHLSMSRGEIANHLGLAPETLSRQLTELRQAGILESRGRWLKVLDPQGLRTRAHQGGIGPDADGTVPSSRPRGNSF